MASYWMWALVVGGIITVGGVVASRLASDRSRRTDRQAPPPRFSALSITLGALLPIVAFLLCLPARHPFAQGTAMGYGALLGLGAAMVALVALWLATPDDRPSAQAAALASLGGVAIMWLATTQLLFGGDPAYALYGGMAGALLALLPLWRSLRLARDTAAAAALEFFGLAIAVQALGALLAIERYGSALLRPYWGLPPLAFAGGLLGAVVVALLAGRTWNRWAAATGALLTIAVGFGVWVGGEALLAPGHKAIFTFDRHLYLLLLVGWVGFGLLALQQAAGLDRLGLRLAVPLLGVALLVISFNLAGGYGVSLALSAGLALTLPFWCLSEERENGPAFLWLGVLGVLFMGYRSFLAVSGDQFGADRALDLGRHYVFVGLAVGLLWPPAVRGARATFGVTALHWAALVLLPVILFIVFGAKGLVGLILGLWVSQLLLPTIATPRSSEAAGTSEEPPWAPGERARLPVAGASSSRGLQDRAPIFFPLVAVWALIIPRWGDFMLDLPRWIRGVIIGAAIAAVITALGILRERSTPADGEQ